MQLELFVHIAHIEELQKGKFVNCKINYASQYDMRILINPRKYILIPGASQNLLTIRRKTLIDKLGLRKIIKYK